MTPSTYRLMRCVLLVCAGLCAPAALGQPSSLPLAGAIGGFPTDIVIVDDLAYVHALNTGLVIYDLSGSGTPRTVGSIELPVNGNRVIHGGDRVYINYNGCDTTCTSSGFLIVDVALPESPALLGSYERDGLNTRCLSADGPLAHVGTDNGVSLLDFSDPLNPQEVAASADLGPVRTLCVQDDRVYAGTMDARLVVLDDELGVLGSAPLSASPTAALARGDYLYIATTGGMITFDIRDPLIPLQADSLTLDPFINCIVAHGDSLFLTRINDPNGYEVFILDIATPASPSVVSTITWPESGNLLNAGLGCGVREGRLYVTGGEDGVQVFDVTVPFDPQALPPLVTLTETLDIEIAGEGLLCVAMGHAGIAYLDVSDPDRMSELAAIEAAGLAVSIEVDGPLAMVRLQGAGFAVFDHSDPTRPDRLATVELPVPVTGVELSGGLGFVVDQSGSLIVYDMSEPASPVEIGRLEGFESPQSVLVQDKVGVVSAADGLHTVDLSDPANPMLLGSVPLATAAFEMELVGRYVFLALAERGLAIVDLVDPSAPDVIGRRNNAGFTVDVSVLGSEVYLSGQDRILVADASSPEQPFYVVELLVDTSVNFVFGVAALGDRVYTTSTRGGVRVYDTSGIVAEPREELDGLSGVTSGDLAILLSEWGTASTQADVDWDGVVGSGDLGRLLAGWGPIAP